MDSCIWTEAGDGIWETGCGKTCDFLMDGDPEYNGMTFCPFCGAPLKMDV